jgi:peptidoglycan-N-acetylglucosamine deacetylase
MKVTLSFDNGPDREVTPRVLDVLAAAGVRAHFFVLGKHLAQPWAAPLVRRALEEGHRFGNHSYTHETPLGDDPRPDAVELELTQTQRLLEDVAPGSARFRPFGGGGVLGPHLLSAAAVTWLRERRFDCVLWNSVPRDWVDPTGWPATALEQLRAVDHGVVVLHDIPGACLDGLASFIHTLQQRGDELVLDLPADCLPIVAGQPVTALAAIARV